MANDLDRILAIPVWTPDPLASKAKWDPRACEPDAEWSLRPEQALALEAIFEVGGALISMGVGSGKTAVALLAYLAADVEPSEVLILCPARVRSQYYAEHSKYLDRGLRVGVHPPTVASYDALSRTSELTDLTGGVEPRLIVADEAHNLAWASTKAARSGRTKKFLRFAKESEGLRFVAMSATLTTTSVLDYVHLAELALGEGSPLPTSFSRLEAWSRILDSERAGNPPLSEDWWKIRGLWEDARFAPPEAEGRTATQTARLAFQARLISVPGFVRSEEPSCDQPIVIRCIPAFEGSAEIVALRNQVEREWAIDGVEIDDPLQASAKLRQISQGFWYAEEWPDGNVDFEWKAARSTWGRECNRVLGSNRRGLDTPGEVAAEIDAGRAYDAEVEEAWLAWSAARLASPGPAPVPEWFSESLVDDACSRAKADGRRCIVWYSYRAMAAALEGKVDRVFGPGEDFVDGGEATIALSVASHGTGLNLQAFDVSVVLCPMSSGGLWEQLIGRTHRAGREAPVEVWVYTHTPETKKALTGAKTDAKYIHETQGLPMRLLFATYETEENE